MCRYNIAVAKPRLLPFLVVQLCIGVLILSLMFFGFKPWNAAHWVGLAIAAPALVLLFVARFQLGGSFSVVPQARQLVTHGLYSKIRNPIYFFGEIMIAGFFIAIHRPLLLLVLAIVTPLQIVRARKESKVLEEKFGDEYRQYKQRTWF
ncbi:MAG: methyltransferase family protein [Terriglobales bacterium]